MKTIKRILSLVAALIVLSTNVSSQKILNSFALGFMSSSNYLDTPIHEGSRTGIFINYLFIKNISINANLSNGFKRYNLIFYNFPERSRKIFKLNAIDLAVDLKWYFTKPIFHSRFVKNSFLNRMSPYVGMGAILRNPTKMVGVEIDLFTSEPMEIPFQKGYKKLDSIGGKKFIFGVDIIFLKDFFVGVELGRYVFPRDGTRYFETRYDAPEFQEKEHIDFFKLSFGKYF
ncbi:MAG: hypothetical protein AB8F94_22710 [Saprospiraceae bacterium]